MGEPAAAFPTFQHAAGNKECSAGLPLRKVIYFGEHVAFNTFSEHASVMVLATMTHVRLLDCKASASLPIWYNHDSNASVAMASSNTHTHTHTTCEDSGGTVPGCRDYNVLISNQL